MESLPRIAERTLLMVIWSHGGFVTYSETCTLNGDLESWKLVTRVCAFEINHNVMLWL